MIRNCVLMANILNCAIGHNYEDFIVKVCPNLQYFTYLCI